MQVTAYESFARRLSMVEGMRESKRKSVEALQVEVSGLEEKMRVLSLTEKVLKHLIDRLAKGELERMDKLVTYGLSLVFPGRDIKFVSRIEEYGKRMRVVLRTVEAGREISPASKSSVQVIESFIIRLLCMRKLHRAPLMLLDETFAAVDNVNIENVGKLITQLSSKTGMDILLVTHLPQFADWGDHMYRIVKHKDNDWEKARVERIR